MVTLFLLMGVGFVLAQLGKLYPDGVSQMSTLVLYVVTPCVIIHAFAIERTDGMVRLLLEFAAVYALSTLFCAAVALFCFRGEDPCRRGPMRFAMVYGNNGFMGLPLLLSILGNRRSSTAWCPWWCSICCCGPTASGPWAAGSRSGRPLSAPPPWGSR